MSGHRPAARYGTDAAQQSPRVVKITFIVSGLRFDGLRAIRACEFVESSVKWGDR
jgi:hypothetical protein